MTWPNIAQFPPAPELAPYLDEPPQHPSGAFGKNALLRLRFETRLGRSILARMERRAPLIVQKALYCDEGMPDLPVVYIISNAGGILQGDRYTLEFTLGSQARGHVTTQAATKIHEMDANHARQAQSINLEEGAYLEYLPDPIIPFRHARFLSDMRIRIAPSATLLYSEILAAGRKYYQDGELFQFDLFSSNVTAERPDGTTLFAEKFLLEPHRRRIDVAGIMGGFHVFGNVVLLTPRAHADAIFDRTPTRYDPAAGIACGASRLPNDAGLIFKVLAMEAAPAKSLVREFWSIVRPQVTGRAVPPEFPWR